MQSTVDIDHTKLALSSLLKSPPNQTSPIVGNDWPTSTSASSDSIMIKNDTTSNKSPDTTTITTMSMPQTTSTPPTTGATRIPKRYADELGFYRPTRQTDDYDQYYKTVRRDLRISHFDRTNDYEQWKTGWDIFMKNKLVRNEPVTLNNELKLRLRSGIPQDYRRKVWTALINMRVRPIRELMGANFYQQLVASSGHQDSQLFLTNGSTRNNREQQQQQQDSVEIVASTEGPIPEPPPLPPLPESASSTWQLSLGLSSSQRKILGNDISNKPTNGGGTLINNNGSQPSQSPVKASKSKAHRPKSRWSTLDKCSKQIELDLLRTLPNNKHFDRPDSMGIQRVRRVLRAYAKYNPRVGYCQGMNRLAALALLILPEEDTFWCLVAIIECIMPKDYYIKPWLAQVDCCVMNDLLVSKMPVLHKHLVELDTDLTLFTWFFTIFVDGFKPELTLRIWDCFLLEGDKVLFRFALALVQIAQENMLKMNDFATINSYLHQLGSSSNFDIEHLFHTFEKMNPLSARTIQSRRAYHHKRIKATFEE